MIDLIQAMPNELMVAELPVKTPTYQPVGHDMLVSYLGKKIEHAGFDVTGARFQHAAHGNKMVGTLDIVDPNMGHDEIGMSMVFRNSYDRSMSVGLGSSTTTFVCLNGQISAGLVSLRKHTTNIGRDIEGIIDKQILNMHSTFEQHIQDMEMLKQVQINESTMHEIVGSLFMEHKVLTTTQINIVRKEVSFSENFQMLRGGEMSMYNMYQNVTQSLKISSPTNYTNDHVKVHELLTAY